MPVDIKMIIVYIGAAGGILYIVDRAVGFDLLGMVPFFPIIKPSEE